MIFQLPVWCQRFIALTLFLVGLCGVYIVAISPLTSLYRAQAGEILSNRERLGQFLAIVDSKKQKGALNSGPISHTGKRDILLRGESDGLVLASLQSRLKSVATANGVRFQGARSLPIRAEGNLRYIGVRMSVSGNTQGLRDMLHAIESGTPYLMIENAHLRTQQRNASAQAKSPIVVTAQIDVFGAIEDGKTQ